MPIQQETDLARLVARRAQRSIALIAGLRNALRDIGRDDLTAVLDLISEDAEHARAACDRLLVARKRARRLRILSDLGRLSSMGGPRAARVAQSLAEDLSTPSGSFPVYQSGGL